MTITIQTSSSSSSRCLASSSSESSTENSLQEKTSSKKVDRSNNTQEEVIMGKPTFRLVILMMAVAATGIDYLSRTNITMAIIAMSNHSVESNTSIKDVCPYNYNEKNSSTDLQTLKVLPGPKFDWDQKMQGMILGSFFYSFVLMQVPSGRLAESFGGKWIVSIGLLGTGLLNLVTPLIAYSYGLLITSRVLLGLLQGGIFPACYSIVYNWLPQNERSLGFAMMDVGTNIGTIVATTMTGYLSEYGFADGWPSTFYTSGMIAITHFMIWSCVASSKPSFKDTLIKKDVDSKENYRRRYSSTSTLGSSGYMSTTLTETNNNSLKVDHQSYHAYQRWKLRERDSSESDTITDCPIEIRGVSVDNSPKTKSGVPWKKIFTSGPVLSLLLFRFSFFWTFLIIMSKLPTYMNDILHVSPTENGVLNAMLYVANSISLVTGGFLSERVIQKELLSRTTTRKLFAVTASLGAAGCLALVPFVGCAPRVATSLLVLGMFFQGFTSGGDIPIPAEMTSKFPTTIYALANMCSMSPGFIAPYAVGYILDSGPDVKFLWTIVFVSSAGISAAGSLIFWLFSSADIQDFDHYDDNCVNDCCEPSFRSTSVSSSPSFSVTL